MGVGLVKNHLTSFSQGQPYCGHLAELLYWTGFERLHYRALAVFWNFVKGAHTFQAVKIFFYKKKRNCYERSNNERRSENERSDFYYWGPRYIK